MTDKVLMHNKENGSNITRSLTRIDEKAQFNKDAKKSISVISYLPESLGSFCQSHILAFLISLLAVLLVFLAHFYSLEISEYQHDELHTSYTFDFTEALKQRREAMKKYSFTYSVDGVDKRSNLSWEEFRDVYDAKWPVIITDLVPTWPASNWTIDYFLKNYSDLRVTMVGAQGLLQEGFTVPLKLFLETINLGSEHAWTYMQDELLMLQHPELRAHVLDTVYTEENFFRLFPKSLEPWDCLFLWGSAYSRSRLHIDPYNWTGTNAVISGLKKWKLFPPGQDDHLYIGHDFVCGFPLDCKKYNSKLDMFGSDGKNQKLLKKVKFLEVDQMPGEMLFIPTGWYHQAFNAVPTLAVSGQFMNKRNYKIVLEEIFKYGQVQRSVLPQDINKFSPKELVEHVMKRIPDHIIEEGVKWTEALLRMLKQRSRS